MTLGIFWVGQQTQPNHLTRSDRSLSWIHILLLFALLAYWVNLLMLGATLYLTCVCAHGLGLVRDDISPR